MKKKYDKLLLIAVIIIAIFGIVMIYSASSIWAEYKYDDPFKYVKAQSAFFIIGLFLIFVISKINIDILHKRANLILLICFILLALVLIPGIGSIRNGSRSWFGIGGLGIQPSEFAKLGLIIYVAKYLASNQRIIKDIKKGVLPILLVIGVFFVLIMLEPDFGTAMVIVLTLVVMIFISGVKISFFVKIGLVGLLGIVGLIIVAPYRMERIVSLSSPPTIIQSKVQPKNAMQTRITDRGHISRKHSQFAIINITTINPIRYIKMNDAFYIYIIHCFII